MQEPGCFTRHLPPVTWLRAKLIIEGHELCLINGLVTLFHYNLPHWGIEQRLHNPARTSWYEPIIAIGQFIMNVSDH